MVADQKFGSAHTSRKLDKLEDYLKAFSKALKNQNFYLIFFDAFAGTGDIQIASEGALLENVEDYSPFIEGSARRALQLGKAFDEYIFVEKSRAKANNLENLKRTHSSIADRISICRTDANDALSKFCRDTNWNKCRAVVFLDPYGNQVKWRTIEAIAKTGGIDLWYLFPAGLGVHRQIGKDARFMSPMRLRSTNYLVRQTGGTRSSKSRIAKICLVSARISLRLPPLAQSRSS